MLFMLQDASSDSPFVGWWSETFFFSIHVSHKELTLKIWVLILHSLHSRLVLSAVQSPAIQRRSPVARRMKTTPCPSRPPPQHPATSLPWLLPLLLPHLLLHILQRTLRPAASLPAPASGAWRRCHSSFPRYKVGNFSSFYFQTVFIFFSF